MRLAAVVLLAAVLAGCGGAVREPGAEELAPAGALAVVEVDVEAARGVLGSRASKLEGLGDRVVVVLLDGREHVVLARPEDPERLREHGATREVEGWTAAARSEAVLDRYESALARGRLEPRSFPADALATVHAPGKLALALTLEGDRIRVAGTRLGRSDVRPVSAGLLEAAPADAYAVLAFGAGLDARPYLEPLSGGGVAWARPGRLLPDVGLLLEDERDRERVLDALPPGLHGLVGPGDAEGGFERPDGVPDELTAFLYVDLAVAFPGLGLGTVLAYSDGQEIAGSVELRGSR